MTDELSFGLADLDVQDDLDVAMDNETYQDQANPAPPVAGNYLVKVLKLGPKTDNKEKQPIYENKDKRYPILSLMSVEIIDGLGTGVTRKVGLFQDIKTKPFDRFGTPASNLMDLSRALGTDNWQGIPAGLAAVNEAVQLGTPAAIQLDWSIYDSQFVEDALKQLGLTDIPKDQLNDEQKKLKSAVYNNARVTGMRFFPFNEKTEKFIHVLQRDNVTFKHPVTGVNITVEGDHRALEARATITRYFPKADVDAGRTKIGPSKVKRPAVVAA